MKKKERKNQQECFPYRKHHTRNNNGEIKTRRKLKKKKKKGDVTYNHDEDNGDRQVTHTTLDPSRWWWGLRWLIG